MIGVGSRADVSGGLLDSGDARGGCAPAFEGRVGVVEMSQVELAYAAARWVTYCCVLLAAGAALFLALIHDGLASERRVQGGIIVGGAVLGAVGSLVAMCFHGIEISGVEGFRLNLGMLVGSLESVVGLSTIARLAGLALLLAGVTRALEGRGSWALLLGGGVAALSFTLSGHTVTAQPAALAYAADAGHLLAGSVWFGGLAVLGVVLARRRATGDAVGGAGMVARFSAWASGALLVVAVAGAAMAWLEIRTLEMLTTTGYGRTLGLKLAIVAVVVMIGAYNNRRLVPAIVGASADGPGAAETAAWRRFGMTVRIESVGIIAVLGVTAVLVHEPPPRPYSDAPTQHSAAPAVISGEARPWIP